VIKFTGPITDVRPCIKESSVVVLPSYREGTPRSVLEALSIGRAVITTNTAGCKQTVNLSPPFQNGFLVPVRDVDALASRMEYYINHPDEIIRHGKNGRKYAEEKFDVYKVNRRMLE